MNKICLERNKLALINVFMLRKKVQWKNLQEQKILTRNLYKKCFKCMCVMCVCWCCCEDVKWGWGMFKSAGCECCGGAVDHPLLSPSHEFFYRILNFLLRYLLEVKYLRGRTINIFIFFMFQTVFLLFFCFLAFLLIRKRECARYALPLS